MSKNIIEKLFKKKEQLVDEEANKIFEIIKNSKYFKHLNLTKQEFLIYFDTIKEIYLNDAKCEKLDDFHCYDSNFFHINLIRDSQTNKLKKIAIECPKINKIKILQKIKKNYLFHTFSDELFQEKLSIYRNPKSINLQTIFLNMRPLIKVLIELKSSNFNFKYGYYISGPMGIGKTHVMIAFCNECAKHGKKIAFCFMPDLVHEIKVNMGDQKKSSILLDNLINCDILVLDDLLAEYTNPWFYNEYLMIILNRRLQSKKITFFISNIPFNGLKNWFEKIKLGTNGTRLIERIKGLINNRNIIDIQDAINVRDMPKKI